MKRILGSFNRRGNSLDVHTQNAPRGDSPESIVAREATAFCESNAPGSPTAGDEFLHLPAIVEAAESSPAAAQEAANCVRKFLSKDYTSRAYAQYNAVMLMRILTDNPGRTFTRNFDATFIKTVKEVLKDGKDLSVQQILRETLESFRQKTDNETLSPLLEMWKKEQAKSNTKVFGNSAGLPIINGPPAPVSYAGNHFARQHRPPRSLPPPDELVARIEEARTTAKLLSQTVQSTPVADVPNNDLIKEFADRASSASRSIQGYIHSTDPAPDEDTLLTLIETNDQLSVAMSKHQRAVLQARRALGSTPPAVTTPPPTNQVAYAAPRGPPPGALGAVSAQDHDYPPPRSPPPARGQNQVYSPPTHPTSLRAAGARQSPERRDQSSKYDVAENPFADESYEHVPPPQPYGLFSRPIPTSHSYGHETESSEIRPLQPRAREQMPHPPSSASYAYHQDPATNNLAMSGAIPPPDQQENRNMRV